MKVLICGDICPTSDYRYLFDTPQKLFGNITDLIKNSDFTLCNLECPATDCETKITKAGPHLKANVRDIEMLKNIGFDAFSIANNHILDYGYTGCIDTLKAAQNNNVLIFGGGENISHAQKPLIVEIENKKIGFLSFAEHEFNIATDNTPGANLFDPYISLNQIHETRKACDYLIVLYHGGIEHYIYPSPLLQKKCRSIATAGADLVLCQHSHCIGTFEKFKNTTIVYGQGNCIFGYREGNTAWNEGLIIELNITDTVDITYHLINASKDGVALCDDTSRIKKFYADSQKLTNNVFLQKEFSKFCKKRANIDLPLLFAKNRIFIKLNRILREKLFKPRKKAIMITHNLIRCDAWNEVIQEDLRSYFNDK